MNSIVESEMLLKNKKLFVGPINDLQKNLNKYMVPKLLLEPYLNDLKSYNFKFAEKTREYLEQRKVLPVISEDPVNKGDASILIRYSILVTGAQINGEFVGIPNLSIRCKYNRDNTKEKNPTDITISTRDFYILCEGATVLKLLQDNKTKVLNAPKLNYYLIKFFSYLLSKTIDKTFSFGRDNADDYSILMYITGFFFCQKHLGFESKKASDYVKRALDRVIDYDYVNSNFLIYNENLVIKDLDQLVEKIKSLPQIRADKFDKKVLVNLYAKNIGENSIFTLEHYFSFVFLLLSCSSNKKAKFFNDSIILRTLPSSELSSFETSLKELLLK